jgi:cytochrome c oxidase subunit 3
MAAHGVATQHKEGLSNGMLGFILFIASEVMFFGGLFAAYFIARADAPSWPPEELLTPDQIAAGVELHLEFWLPFLATILLVTSSVTIQLGVWAIQKGDRAGLIRWIFGTTFYTLTGFHGAHVFGGVIFMMVILARSLAGQFSAKSHEAVEACSFYWHFVDVVWIALFTILYIV